MKREPKLTEWADPVITVAGALSVLASDGLNGMTPNDSALYRLITPWGASQQETEAEVQAIMADIRRRAARLTRHPREEAA